MFDGFNITIEWIKGIFDYIVEFFSLIFSFFESLFTGLRMCIDGVSFLRDIAGYFPLVIQTCVLAYVGVRVVRWILPFD